MGSVSPPPRSEHPEGKKTGAGWPAVALVAVLAAIAAAAEAARTGLKADLA